MKYMKTADIREKFLSFFEKKGCKRMPSSSLIPDDPSLLLTSAGMVQFKPYLLQQKHLPDKYIGATTAQKCLRTNDLDLVGTDGRHLSFFEMMGNFGFGKYGKHEMCKWALEFSLDVLEMPKDKLYFTVYEKDDETYKIWESLGIDPKHIVRLGEEDNFWRAGPTGPCGPCSELYFDQGPEMGCGKPTCAPGCDCDRYLEYWNLVFEDYNAKEDGTLEPLPHKNIDTGMGLERMAAILQGVHSNFDTDILRGLVEVGEKLSGKPYEKGNKSDDAALRILADHARSVTFMIADGILPSNEGRGYVLRRLLRRAVMKGRELGIAGSFMGDYVDKVVEDMGDEYPEIVQNKAYIKKMVHAEEDRFGATLHQGRMYLDDALQKLSGTTLPGKTAFTLHDTYGFPIEITQEICKERGIDVDVKGFHACMEQQRDRARKSTQDDADAAWSTYDGSAAALLEDVGKTEFIGYDHLEADAHVIALIHDGKRVDTLVQGQDGAVVLDRTPFYAEMGGQVGDTGTIIAKDSSSVAVKLTVTDTQEPEDGLIIHNVHVDQSRLDDGFTVHVQVDGKRRARISRNHSATHILQWALVNTLGDHVKQAGSLVAPDRLRFDFTHFEALSAKQIRAIEDAVNEKIMEAHPVHVYETSLSEARAQGVVGEFGEKYGDIVRVVDMDGFSRELCGGTHVTNTSEIGLFKIVSEGSVGSNVRRIEAVTSYDALQFVNTQQDLLHDVSEVLNVKSREVPARVHSVLDELKQLKHNAKKAAAHAEESSVVAKLDDATTKSSKGYSVVVLRFEDMDAKALRSAWDAVRNHVKGAVACVLASAKGSSALLLAAGDAEAVKKGFHAGDIIHQIAPMIKGGGGGKPAMAQAGGKDTAGIDKALAHARELLQ